MAKRGKRAGVYMWRSKPCHCYTWFDWEEDIDETEVINNIVDSEENDTATILIRLQKNRRDVQLKVSSYLVSSERRSSIYSWFCCIIRQKGDSDCTMNDMLANANMLTNILHNRLDQNFALHLEDTAKHDNFALSWFRDNTPRFVEFVTLNRYIIKDIKCVDGTTTLLRNVFCSDFHHT